MSISVRLCVTFAILILVPVVQSYADEEIQSQEQKTNFDPVFAKTTAIYAFASYCQSQFLNGWKCWWCSQVPALDGVVVTYNKTADVQAYVGYSTETKTIYVSFRGTVASITNWLYNTQFVLSPVKPSSSASVHVGFLKAYRSLSTGVIESIQKALAVCTDCRIVATGHSLGGALAQIAALDIIEFYKNVTVITYGSPRVGNLQFSLLVKDLFNDTLRIVNGNDVVTKIPSSIFLGYHHVATEVWERASTIKYCNPEEGEDATCSRSVSILLSSVKDHYLYMGINQQSGEGHGCITGNNGEELDLSKIKYLDVAF